MSYFPNAYKKVFIGTTFKTTGKTENLVNGEFGFFSPKTWTAVPTANATPAQNPMVILASGSAHTVDKLGMHGGYKESIKSQGINPRYIHRFYKSKARPARNQVIKVGYDGTNASSAPSFVKGRTYHLRLDIKGSAVLRFMNHNLYHAFDAWTGVDVDGSEPAVDPVAVMIQFKKRIDENSIFNQFIQADVYAAVGGGADTLVDPTTYVEVTDPTVIPTLKASLKITVAYIDTKFSDFSFEPRDYYEVEPIQVYASLIDDFGNPQKAVTITVTELQSTRSPQGLGETLLREKILFDRYRQEHYKDDRRLQEITDQKATTLDKVNRAAGYDFYFILHSVPRKANPSSTLDSDQYLLQIAIPENTDMTAFEAWMAAYLTAAGTGVQLEDLTGEDA
jgi:hypothetical protein